MEEQTIEYLKRVKIPVIMIDRVIGRDFDWVGVESRESTREMVNYLIRLGHKKLACWQDSEELIRQRSVSADIRLL